MMKPFNAIFFIFTFKFFLTVKKVAIKGAIFTLALMHSGEEY